MKRNVTDDKRQTTDRKIGETCVNIYINTDIRLCKNFESST